MTQDVQPLTWQKRTNLEEHQQFFSKINEIITNLAPTVDKAEQAIASANAAIATANAASASADAASQQAQTAANTVAGYDARMADVESKNTQQDTAISALQTADGQNVKLTGAQNITGIKTVPTEATGTHSQQIANSGKIAAELDNYSPMVRTTGNQSIAGFKIFPGTISSSRNFDVTVTPDSTRNLVYAINQVDMNGVQIFNIWAQQLLDGKINVYLGVRNKDGTQKNVLLGASD